MSYIKASRLLCGITLFCILVLCVVKLPVKAEDQAVSATISGDTVLVGKTISITSKTQDVVYTSSDATIAYVNDNGTVSGKKPGTVTIQAKKKGYRSKAFRITVKRNKKLPDMRVACDEIIYDAALTDAGFTVKVTNKASKKAAKIELQYQLHTASGDQKLVAEFTNVKPGKTKTFCTPSYVLQSSGDQSETAVDPVHVAGQFATGYTVRSITVYAGDGRQTKNIVKETYKYTYGTKDTTAPEFSGFVGKNSYKKDQVFMTVYDGEYFDYTKYISVEDDRDRKVSFTVDDSALDGAKPGVYKVYLTAKDAAGNETKTYAKVNLRKKTNSLDSMAEQILAGIIQDSWSDVKKAEAIYQYIRKNYSYVDHSDKSSWTASAAEGLRYQNGDCFTYYAAARILLTRAGIPNIMIKKVDGYASGHWWNLVYVKGGWYHFDTTPRKKQAYFCLLTDSQILDYSHKNHNCHDFNGDLYPVRAKKTIKKLIYGKRY